MKFEHGFALGILALASVLILLILIFGNFDLNIVYRFIDVPIFMSITAALFAVTIVTGESRSICTAFRALLKKEHLSAEETLRAVGLFRLLSKSVIYSSIIIFVIGQVNMLYNMDDPHRIGPSLAISWISIFYGALLNLLVFNPAAYILEKRLPREDKS